MLIALAWNTHEKIGPSPLRIGDPPLQADKRFIPARLPNNNTLLLQNTSDLVRDI